ncbi:MAG: bifunctional phosphoribosylaminoimidazolecarboxamide formyltransferase/IMP cyclohydrolase [Chloracidobacterium sp.]|nr:bifunctional phosphoribosylaminoimidazolecarboxamide formyltransferase/IMP cyclohydrolase [Chloracidobacterium sp.]
MIKVRRALLSVSDKTGLVELARVLDGFGVEIISTGGTAKALRDAGLTVRDVSGVTGFPEMMDGRVKTLHPKIHGAFLALRDNEEHIASMDEHGIEPIDLVVVNLYPFEQTIAKDGVTLAEAVENIDIGGPAMIRSAAKNWRDVAIVTDPAQYGDVQSEMTANAGSLSLKMRSRLAAAAYTRTAQYDTAISNYLSNPSDNAEPGAIATGFFPDQATLRFAKVSDLRYGENPHQRAARYTADGGGIANAEQLHGKEMSFNNYVDADAAWALVNDLDDTAVAIIKHTNPSGVGVGETNLEAYKRALATDPVSAFGGIVAFNRKVDAEAAAVVIEVFSEVIIAPDYDDDALEVFKTKKNLRVLRVSSPPVSKGSTHVEYKQIAGGFLVQDGDDHTLKMSDLNIVTERRPSDDEVKAMLFASTVCKHVKSNAIVLAGPDQTFGVGAGQMNRVDSVRIAAMRAERFGFDLTGSALASDAFFPFRDSVDEAARLGVTAIIQPGGSVKDDESIAAANEHGIAMAFTGIRHFKH